MVQTLSHYYVPSADYLITTNKILLSNMKMQAVITGKRVHGVGYRVFLLQKALERGVQRFDARNVVLDGEQQVVVRIEGEQAMIEAFQSGVNDEYPPDARVFNISFGAYDGYVISISDFMHLIQVEQLTKGIPAIISIDTKQDRLLEKQDQMLGKQDQMLEKQDQMLGRQDQVLQKMDRMETSITGEIHDLRTDLRSYLDRKLSAIELDIQQIKEKIGMQ